MYVSSKFPLNSFKFRGASVRNRVRDVRSIMELGPNGAAVKNQKAIKSGEGRCNAPDRTQRFKPYEAIPSL